MMRVVWSVFACAAVAATPVFAQFEGQIDMKITARGGVTGAGKVFAAKAGTRTEMDIGTGRAPIHTTTLVKLSTPDVMYLINDYAKTYSVLDTKRAPGQDAKLAGDKGKEPYSVKVVGAENVLGHATKHALLSRPGDKSEMEVWTTRDFPGLTYESTRGLMRRSAQDDGAMMKALRDSGADGFFVKMVTREKGNAEPLTTIELTKAEKKPLPASMFEVPAGYVKQ
jgi:Domain of unknown function (DUF4412)